MFIKLAYALLWAAFLAYIVHARLGPEAQPKRPGKRLAGWIATGAATLAAGLLAAGLIERGWAAGHWPLTNHYEFALGFVWATISIYLLLEAGAPGQKPLADSHSERSEGPLSRRTEVLCADPEPGRRIAQNDRTGGAYTLAVALLAATYALTRPAAEQAITPLLPALRSVWLQVHVLSALVGYGAFGVAAGFGLARLLPISSPTPKEEGRVESASERDLARNLQFTIRDLKSTRAVALGFPWLTLSILAGAIWAQNAWGRYWGWDPKETWALATWLWYLLILHARTLRNWRGRRLAGLVVAGMGMVIFTFLGVPWLVRTARLESLHGF